MIACVVCAALALPPGVLVDRVVAVVDKEVITYSDLLRETRVELVMRYGPQQASGELSKELLDTFLGHFVDQVIIAAYARRLGGVEVSEEEVAAKMAWFAQHFTSPTAYHAFLRRFDIPEASLRDILRRAIRNDRYVESRMQSWRIGARGGGQEMREAYQRWIRELRETAEIRLLGAEGELELQ